MVEAARNWERQQICEDIKWSFLCTPLFQRSRDRLFCDRKPVPSDSIFCTVILVSSGQVKISLLSSFPYNTGEVLRLTDLLGWVCKITSCPDTEVQVKRIIIMETFAQLWARYSIPIVSQWISSNIPLIFLNWYSESKWLFSDIYIDLVFTYSIPVLRQTEVHIDPLRLHFLYWFL